jgi:pimeloyl-ACP methyl ester carboxylesterase
MTTASNNFTAADEQTSNRRVRDARFLKRVRTRRQKVLLALIIASVLAVCGALWPFTNVHLQALAVLKQISGQPVPWIAAKLVGGPVTTEEIQISGSAGPIRARLYRPVNKPDVPGLIVLHGLHHLGIDEPRLLEFSRAMASCGLQVLTPELPGIRDYSIDQNSVRVIGESTKWFAQKTNHPVGVVGLSFSGGLALVAAADPAYQQDFKFLFAVGSQDNMDHVEKFFLTDTETRPDGSIEHLHAHEYGVLVLEYQHLEDFVPASDIAAIRPVLQQHLYEDKAAEIAATQKLNPKQKSEVLHLFDSRSPTTLATLAANEPRHREEMESLSPHGKLKGLTIPVYLLHGHADNVIPSAETLWIASELPHSTPRAVLLSPVLSHLDMDGAKPSAWDQWRLVHFIALVMNAAQTN